KTLAWILNSYNDEIFKIFEGEDDDFRLLEEVLEQFSNKNVNESNLARIFSEDIADEHSLMEYLIKEAEDKVFDYLVFDYVEESSNKCSDDIVSLPCFREIYCEIGRELDEEVRAEMIRNFEEFSDYIEKIIDNRINSRTAYNGEVSNANGWRYGSNENNGQIDELSDVESRKRDETWVDLLCQAAPAPPATE
ncbi:MAG: hypothetical protein GDA46_05450, partial [Bdellovibrionales bacterium]|nr:hypothetical protein [Bdellovibrionales bacterium]